MKIIFIMTALCSLFYLTTHAQDGAKSDFQVRMNQHIALKISDPAFMATAKEIYGHTCEKHHTVTEEEIKARAAEAEKHRFIQANMDEYMRLYFPAQVTSRSITADTFICDNGGFENDFLYYKGYVSTYTLGSNTCSPDISSWTPVTLPVTNRIEIMSPGLDPLIGIQKVKFGNKSLRVNSPFGHIHKCDGDYGIDRVTKRFKVTAENRRFTVWYALALENPTDHVNRQPFLNIKCDKAPADELCFDAAILKCEKYYNHSCSYDSIDVLNWTCHRFNIPASEIGTIATIEMIVADCGQGAHFGYAYFDGFCEECTGSSLGSGTFYDTPYNGEIGLQFYRCGLPDDLVRVCGSYTLPTLCDGPYTLDSLIIPNFPNAIINIDTSNETFCFDLLLDWFENNECIDLSALLYFSSPTTVLPVVFTNNIEICKSDFQNYSYGTYVENCNNNGTPDNLSDDYYYVTINLFNPHGVNWDIYRQLDDPYPNESGYQLIESGSYYGIFEIGPFLIQEGCWDLRIFFPDCEFVEHICPPDFCSGCPEFYGLEITDVQCHDNPNGDEWSFNFNIPGNGTFNLNGEGANSPQYSFGNTYTINVGPISSNCELYELTYEDLQTSEKCIVSFTVCPPKPCGTSCPLEVNVVKRTCDSKGDTYTVEFDISNVGNHTVCYATNQSTSTLTPMPASGILGPFSSDVEITFYLCSGSNCTDCNNRDCFKTVKVYKPNCSSGHFDGGQPRTNIAESSKELNVLSIIPNPVTSSEIRIISPYSTTFVDVFDYDGKIVETFSFQGNEVSKDISYLNRGVYILRYHAGNKFFKSTKLVKL